MKRNNTIIRSDHGFQQKLNFLLAVAHLADAADKEHTQHSKELQRRNLIINSRIIENMFSAKDRQSCRIWLNETTTKLSTNRKSRVTWKEETDEESWQEFKHVMAVIRLKANKSELLARYWADERYLLQEAICELIGWFSKWTCEL